MVCDRGVGIAPEDQARLFERFERVRLDRDITGYGVGLWIVRRVVEADGGSVTVESRLGEGARFTVKLPARVQEGSQSGRFQETVSEPRPLAFP